MSIGEAFNNKILVETVFNKYMCISYKIDDDNYIDLFKYEGDLEEEYPFLKNSDNWQKSLFEEYFVNNKLLDLDNKELLADIDAWYFKEKELAKTDDTISSFRERTILFSNDDALTFSKDNMNIVLSDNFTVDIKRDLGGLGYVFLKEKESDEQVYFVFNFDTEYPCFERINDTHANFLQLDMDKCKRYDVDDFFEAYSHLITYDSKENSEITSLKDLSIDNSEENISTQRM